MIERKSRTVKIGSVVIGGRNPIAVQSMLSPSPKDIKANIEQALELEEAGCDIVRVAVPGSDGIRLIKALKKEISMPVVADIHFDYKLAIQSAEAGVDKIRINPGNIGGKDRVKAVAEICNEKNIPIRIGVNSGSVEKEILEKYGKVTPEAMVESAFYHASLLEEFNFNNIVLSMKSNNVFVMTKAYELASEKSNYPLHLGVTHTGTVRMGVIKSAIGIGGLLARGIGDTFRVSLTAPPVEEIRLAKDILEGLGVSNKPEIISCPTCGRCQTDVYGLTEKVEKAFGDYKIPITIAVMGCVVNGPGEAKEADIGVTGIGNGKCIIFIKGEPLRTVGEENIIEELKKEVEKL